VTSTSRREELEPNGPPTETVQVLAKSIEAKSIEVLSATMQIHELCIERPAVIAYLQTISPEKQEIAFVHALEVGVTELLARRERFRH
jgi:hypothetical protein